ncbi:iron complex transport system ATP-binding protein [Syntrophus gentianae]|uniref:Iron complex transport system ATP-binding protein n=1 Tax=Syntrophus gentianae TaxID=43775 RepID=A0A1H7UVP2_9BACT|nr:iron complex transport system ATP-binding protein [Syntrophus gentianae]
MVLLNLKNVSFRYDANWVLRDLSCDVAQGEFLGIIGPNGSGKTTLLRICSGILVPGRGMVALEGRDIRNIPRKALARTMAFVAQDSPELFHFKVNECVLMGRAPHLGRLQFEKERDFAITRQAMEATGTLLLASRNLADLSGGEKKRVHIARALAQEPEILFLDESTAYLDMKHATAIFDLLKALNRDQGLTVIIVTHDINTAALYCDRLLMMHQGSIFAEGRPEEIITEANIREVYETRVTIDRNPENGLPRISLLPQSLSDPRKPVKAGAAPQL